MNCSCSQCILACIRLLCGIFLCLICFLLKWSYAGEPLTIVALGDSTTAGTPAFRSPAEVPPEGAGDVRSQYVYWVQARHPEWKIHNRGVNGERTDQILKRFETDVLLLSPDILIVLAGVNDLYQGHPASRVIDNLKSIYERAAQAKIQVIACTILPFNSSTSEVRARMAEINAWIRTYTSQHNLAFCDTSLVLEDPENPGKLSRSSDGLHPDVEGYRMMGEAIAQVLERRLV